MDRKGCNGLCSLTPGDDLAKTGAESFGRKALRDSRAIRSPERERLLTLRLLARTLSFCCGPNFSAIEGKTKAAPKSGKRPFGGVGLRRLDRPLMRVPERLALGLAKARTFPNKMPAARRDSYLYPGNIAAADFVGPTLFKHPLKMDDLPLPAAIAENGIRLRDGKPALDIGDLSPIRGPAVADPALGDLPAQKPELGP